MRKLEGWITIAIGAAVASPFFYTGASGGSAPMALTGLAVLGGMLLVAGLILISEARN
jgi:hypothetical protein